MSINDVAIRTEIYSAKTVSVACLVLKRVVFMWVVIDQWVGLLRVFGYGDVVRAIRYVAFGWDATRLRPH
jgi:hypothetical protein